MENKNLGDFIRETYLKKLKESNSLSAMDFEDAIHLGIKWQKEHTDGIEEVFRKHSKDLNRIEVIDYSKGGRAYTNYSVRGVEISLQDNNETLKVFIK